MLLIEYAKAKVIVLRIKEPYVIFSRILSFLIKYYIFN